MKGFYANPVRRLFSSLLLPLVFAGCDVRQEVISVPRFEQVTQASLKWEAQIDRGRMRAAINLRNTGAYPVQCDQIGFRAIFDYPVSYLEAGEVAESLLRVFIPAGGSISLPPIVSNDPERQIRSVQGGVFDQCRAASFQDACENVNSVASYRGSFSVLFGEPQIRSCSELYDFLDRERVVDLRHNPGIDLALFDLLPFALTFLVSERDFYAVNERVSGLRVTDHQVLPVAEACINRNLRRLWRNRSCFITLPID